MSASRLLKSIITLAFAFTTLAFTPTPHKHSSRATITQTCSPVLPRLRATTMVKEQAMEHQAEDVPRPRVPGEKKGGWRSLLRKRARTEEGKEERKKRPLFSRFRKSSDPEGPVKAEDPQQQVAEEKVTEIKGEEISTADSISAVEVTPAVGDEVAKEPSPVAEAVQEKLDKAESVLNRVVQAVEDMKAEDMKAERQLVEVAVPVPAVEDMKVEEKKQERQLMEVAGEEEEKLTLASGVAGAALGLALAADPTLAVIGGLSSAVLSSQKSSEGKKDGVQVAADVSRFLGYGVLLSFEAGQRLSEKLMELESASPATAAEEDKEPEQMS